MDTGVAVSASCVHNCYVYLMKGKEKKIKKIIVSPLSLLLSSN